MRAQRDLLVLPRKSLLNKEQLELEIELLDSLLFTVENIDAVCLANEVVDVNRCKIISRQDKVYKVLMKTVKPFVFISNKN